MAASALGDLYAGYESWKHWDQPFKYSVDDALYFHGETRGIKIAGADLLEVGFGSGSFLAWAKERGARVAGTELNSSMLQAAQKFSILVLPSDFEQVATRYKQCFDTIVAFDVFEHLDIEQIRSKLRACDTMLTAGGHLLLRFPNGQSPFGLICQHGDPTHKTALSRLVIERLMQGTSFEVVRYKAQYRIVGRDPVRAVVRLSRYAARSLIALVLNLVYGQNIPWDAVVTLVLHKRRIDSALTGNL